MDILNWLHIKKQQLIRTTLDSPQDLLVLGADVSYQKRGDKYQSYAIPAEDFLASTSRPYKVYTALLTQSGGDVISYIENFSTLGSQNIIKGVTYRIDVNDENVDFSLIGAPSNAPGTYFVATVNAVNTDFSDSTWALEYNTGAPVVTVLENTIGNVWFTYDGIGDYSVRSIGAFTVGKTYVSTQLNNNSNAYNTEFQLQDPSSDSIRLQAKDENWNQIDLDGFGIVLEIRVYN